MAGTICESQAKRCASNPSRSLCSARSRRKTRPPCGKPSNAIDRKPRPARSPRAIAQQIEVILFAARLLRLLDRDPPDDPVLVDDERSALRVAGLAKEDAVLLRHVALRVEIGEQRRAQPLVALERAQAPAIVHGHAEHGGVLALILHPARPDLLQLLRADGREGSGQDDDYDVAAAEAGDAGGPPSPAEQLEVGDARGAASHVCHQWLR